MLPVHGPFRQARIDGAADGMGDHGPATRASIDAGRLPPDQLCGLTLFLMARQAAAARTSAEPDAGETETDRRASVLSG